MIDVHDADPERDCISCSRESSDKSGSSSVMLDGNCLSVTVKPRAVRVAAEIRAVISKSAGSVYLRAAFLVPPKINAKSLSADPCRRLRISTLAKGVERSKLTRKSREIPDKNLCKSPEAAVSIRYSKKEPKFGLRDTMSLLCFRPSGESQARTYPGGCEDLAIMAFIALRASIVLPAFRVTSVPQTAITRLAASLTLICAAPGPRVLCVMWPASLAKRP
jgi:hypothetical protein